MDTRRPRATIRVIGAKCNDNGTVANIDRHTDVSFEGIEMLRNKRVIVSKSAKEAPEKDKPLKR